MFTTLKIKIKKRISIQILNLRIFQEICRIRTKSPRLNKIILSNWKQYKICLP